MMTKTDFRIHKISLIAVFILGNVIIKFPNFYNDACSLWEFFASVAAGIIFAVLFCNIKTDSKYVKYFALLPLIVLLNKTSQDCIYLVDTVRLPNTLSAVLAVIFIALCMYAGYSNRKVLLKLSLTGASLIAVFFIIIILFSLQSADKDFIKPFLKTDGIKSGIALFTESYSSVAVCSFITKNKFAPKINFFGAVLGSLFLTAAYFLTVFLLGAFSESVKFPFICATGIISYGRGFSRFEGIGYIICLISVFIKCTAIIAAIKNIIGNFRRPIYIALSAFLPLSAAVTSISRIAESKEFLIIYYFFALIFLILSVFSRQKSKVCQSL